MVGLVVDAINGYVMIVKRVIVTMNPIQNLTIQKKTNAKNVKKKNTLVTDVNEQAVMNVYRMSVAIAVF
jgi:hypothetical protein